MSLASDMENAGVRRSQVVSVSGGPGGATLLMESGGVWSVAESLDDVEAWLTPTRDFEDPDEKPAEEPVPTRVRRRRRN